MNRVCTKCGVEKDINEFYSYYHSTQKKTRTRHICSICYYKNKNEYKRKKKLDGKQNVQQV